MNLRIGLCLAVVIATGVATRQLLNRPLPKLFETSELVNAPNLSDGLKLAYIEGLYSRIRGKKLQSPVQQLVDTLGKPADPVVRLLTFQITLSQFANQYNPAEKKNLDAYLGSELRKNTEPVLMMVEKALGLAGDGVSAIEKRRVLYSLTNQVYATENASIQTAALLDVAQFTVGEPTPEAQLQAGLAIRAFFNTAGEDAELTLHKFKRVLGNSLTPSTLRGYEEAFRKRYPQFKGAF